MSLTLTEAMQLRKIEFADGMVEGPGAHAEDGFDADAAIATGELGRLIPDLVDALGGELPTIGPDAAPGAGRVAGGRLSVQPRRP